MPQPVIRPISNDYEGRSEMLVLYLVVIMAIFAAGAFGFWVADGGGCQLVQPEDVEAGLDYDGKWWVWGDGTRFGSAPSEDSPITPMNCYDN